VFEEGSLRREVLRDVNFRLLPGESAALLGPSGSGKTTLLSILGCLLTPTIGTVSVASIDAFPKRDISLEQIRRRYLGFVFQHAQLLPFLSVQQNLSAVAHNSGLDRQKANNRINQLLKRLDIDEHRQKQPSRLSGGQRQRVAIARALLHKPSVVLADEPTAALDWENGEKAIDLLLEESRSASAALLVVTHDTRLVAKFDRVFEIDSGRLTER